MSLKEKLMQDLKNAMRDKEVIRKNTVQLVRAAVLQVEKDKRIELDDAGVLDVIAKEMKKRRDALPEFEKSGRQDLIDGLKCEIEVLQEYLPKQLSDEELKPIVIEIIKSIGAASVRDMGRIISAVTERIPGQADGKRINEIAREFLS